MESSEHGASHGPLLELEPDIWRVEAPVPRAPLRRVMTVVRLADGRLVIFSPIALRPAEKSKLEGLGAPAFLVVPNAFHRLDIASYKGDYPAAKVLAPRRAAQRVSQRCPVDGSLDELPTSLGVSGRSFGGTADRDGMVVVRTREGTTVVLNDILFNMPHVPGFQGFVLRHVTASSGGPKVSRVARVALIDDRREVAREFRALAELPDLRRVVVSHHEVIGDHPSDVLRGVAATLGD